MQIDLKVIDKGCLCLSLSLSQEIAEGGKFMSSAEIHNKGFWAKRTGKILERNIWLSRDDLLTGEH